MPGKVRTWEVHTSSTVFAFDDDTDEAANQADVIKVAAEGFHISDGFVVFYHPDNRRVAAFNCADVFYVVEESP